MSADSDIEVLAVRPKVAAKMLGMSVVTLWRLEKRGLIKPVPGTGGYGCTKLFSIEELKRFVAQGIPKASE